MKLLLPEHSELRGSTPSIRRALLEQMFKRSRESSFDEHTERELVRQCGKLLSKETWGSFLSAWAAALSAYPTPLASLLDARIRSGNFTLDGRRFTSCSASSPDYAAVRELGERHPRYLPLENAGKYRFANDCECPLCSDLLQASDAGKFPELVKNNLLLELGGLVLLPNRYPSFPGSSILLSRDHSSQPWERGALEAALWICDVMGFVMLRNHPRDGMSVPAHEHCHVFPADILTREHVESIVPRRGAKFEINSAGTPFATLFIRGASPEETAALARPVLSRLDDEGTRYCLAYTARTLLVTPRRGKTPPPGMSAGVGLHLFDGEDSSVSAAAFDSVPLHGEFDWSSFLH